MRPRPPHAPASRPPSAGDCSDGSRRTEADPPETPAPSHPAPPGLSGGVFSLDDHEQAAKLQAVTVLREARRQMTALRAQIVAGGGGLSPRRVRDEAGEVSSAARANADAWCARPRRPPRQPVPPRPSQSLTTPHRRLCCPLLLQANRGGGFWPRPAGHRRRGGDGHRKRPPPAAREGAGSPQGAGAAFALLISTTPKPGLRLDAGLTKVSSFSLWLGARGHRSSRAA